MALSEDREDQSRDTQMLVEKDGKYELVDACEVQTATIQLQGGDGVGVGVILGKTIPNPAEKKGQLPEKVEEQDTKKDENSEPDEKLANAPNHDIADVSVKQAKMNNRDSRLSAVSTYALGGEIKKEVKKHINSSVRTKSAPGPRSMKEEGDKQKRRNEAAFSAWLTSKNEEIAKQRQMERQECRMKEEKLMHKQSLNEAAYKAWLERKTNELQMKRKSASRPATSVPKVDEAAKQAAFEAWLESKREEHRKKMETEREKRFQEEEKAKNSDPTLVEQAYKSWLDRKSMQAKAEAQLREQYRRAFFSESRRIHKSLQRFEGF